MKGLFHKFLTHTLFFGILSGPFPKVHAGWFTFPELSSLNMEQQRALTCTYMRHFISKFSDFSQALTGNLLGQLQAQCGQSVTLGDVFYRYLLHKERKQENLEDILSAANADIVMLFFRAPNVQTNDLQAATQLGDGLVNVAICKTVKSFAAIWSQEQLEEAFEVLWNSLAEPNEWTSIPDDVIAGALSEYPSIEHHCRNLALAKGDNLCEKVANYFAILLTSHINEQIENNCCCLCMKTCWSISRDFIIPVAMGISKVIELTATTR
ncbi:MAG: hypothetical protein LBH52_02350 [Puniceicoccales bacterium]|jgi:hypothetical protein|nr:hypothetical protein [Puniceicoccales bacterium]